MTKTLTRLLPLVAVSAVLLSPGGTAAAHGSCRHVDVGYTEASVTAKNMRCRTARRLVRGALKVWSCNQYGCRPMYVRGYRCTVGGPAGLVVLKCRKGGRSLRAVWGD